MFASLTLAVCLTQTVAGSLSGDDLVTLLKKVRDHQTAVDKVEENYTYTERVFNSTIDKKGQESKPVVERFEVFHVKGVRLRKKVERNGEPLPQAEQKREESRVSKVIQAIEAGRPPKPTRRQLTISDILRGARLLNGRQESLQDRTVVVCDFEPDPAYKPRDAYDSFVTRIKGTLWVDEANLQVVKTRFSVFAPVKVAGGVFFAIKPGSEFHYEQVRVNDEIWLPRSSDVRFIAKAMMFAGIRIRERRERSEFKRYNVDSVDRGPGRD